MWRYIHVFSQILHRNIASRLYSLSIKDLLDIPLAGASESDEYKLDSIINIKKGALFNRVRALLPTLFECLKKL